MSRLLDDNGLDLDATFFVEQVDGCPTILFESGGGGRNKNYNEGLRVLLVRTAALGAKLTDAVLETRHTLHLPRDERRLPLPGGYPVPLVERDDIQALRRMLCLAQQQVGRRPGARGGGNPTKRIRLFIELDDRLSLGALESHLSAGPSGDLTGRTPPVLRPGADYRAAARPGPDQSAQSLALLRRDPAMAERALRSHADLQDRLSETLREHGLEPLSPGPGEPEFDIAWVVGGTMTVVELKSITEVNEVAQLRQGLGQVLHYRAELQRLYPSMNVKAALVVEREPGALCAKIG